MRKRRKSLSLLLAVFLALGSFGSAPFGFASFGKVQAAELEEPSGPLSGTCGVEGNNITWELVEDPDGEIFPEVSADPDPTCYELILTGTGKFNDGSSYWGSYSAYITAVTINEGITAIGDYGLAGLCSLKSITLPDSVASLETYVFNDCHSLETVVCGSGLVKIGAYAFYDLTSLADVRLNEGLTEIGYSAFQNCHKISEITLPESLVSIETYAFANMSLPSIAIPQSVEEIGYGAFASSGLKSVQLNEGLKKIGTSAFSFCSLESVTLPDSLTAIGECAFYNTPLTSIVIPSNVEEIPYSPFPGTPLAAIEVDEDNKHFFVENNILYEKEEGSSRSPKRVIAYAVSSTASSVEILDGTKLIDNYAFYNARTLSSVQLPDSLTAIGDNAFFENGLRELRLTDSITKIGAYAFSYCRNITEVTIPDNVNTLGTGAFSGCFALTTVSLGKNVPSLDAPFRFCTQITDITVAPDSPYLESLENVVYSKDHTQLFYYAAAKPDNSYHVLEQVKEICAWAIEYTSALEKLYLPASLETIHEHGIYWNQNLAAIYFAGNCPNTTGFNYIHENAKNLILYKLASATGWKDTAFGFPTADWDPSDTTQDSGSLGGISWEYTGSEGRLILTGSGQLADFSEDAPAPWNLYMASIQSVKGDNITGIGSYGFCNASKLFQVETNASLEYAGSYAFSGCGKLKSINISAIDSIGANAFAENASLPGNLTLEKVSSMGEGAFRGCTSISSATLGFCLTDLEKEVFQGCSGLSSFLIPDSVSTIGERAFQGCTSLRSINIPSDACSIGAQAFSGDASLEKVYFYGTIPANWAEDSFEGCHSSLNICYRARQTSWARLNGTWNGIPLLRQERFYQEGEDHYSFANSAESFGYPAGYHFPKRRYWEALGNPCLGTYYYMISPNWAGSCYGMAATTLEFYENPDRFPISSYSPSAWTLYGVDAPGDKDAPLTQLIESYQISQYHPLISGCAGALNANRNDYRGLVQKIEEFERSGGLRVDSNAEPLALALYASFSGHVVIPVSVSQTAEGDFLIMAYNPDAPAGLEAITINKDFSGVKGSYCGISYVPYRTIAASCSIDSQRDGKQRSGADSQNQEDASLYLSIDKEQGMVSDASGNGMDGIAGAYEQKPLAAGDGDAFTGIRSFVLPEGNYQLSANTPEGGDGDTDSVTFYMGSKDCFAEVATSDEQAALNISETGTQDGALVLELKSSSTKGEATAITLVNSQGKERSIGFSSSNASISLEPNDTIKIQAPGQDSITVDGEKISLQDGQAAFPFPKDTDSGDSDNSGSNKPGDGNSGGKEPDSGNDGSSGSKNPDSSNPATQKPSGSGGSTSQQPSTAKREQAVTSIKVNVKKLTLGVGESYTLQASALPAKAKNRKLSYTASNKKLTVTAKGKITAKKTGTAKITVKSSNGKKANVLVTIKKKPAKLKLNAKTKTIRPGWKFQIRARLPKGTASHTLTYTSSRKSVASVSPTGKVTARKKGTAIITVKTYNGKKAKMKIIVQKK